MWKVLTGDALSNLKNIPTNSIHCVITSPPYFGLRDYGFDGQIGLEETPEAFVNKLVEVFREVRRVLREDGTLWLNLGDTYASGGRKTRDADDKLPARSVEFRAQDGLPEKNLIGIPWRVAFALQADGWYLRQDIIWHKPNPMPESVKDRCTKAHEYIFLLSKSARYYFDAEVIRELVKPNSGKNMRAPKCGNDRPLGTSYQTQKTYSEIKGANRRSVWTVTTKPFKGAHFATFPPELPKLCILAGTSEKGCCVECGEPYVRKFKVVGKRVTEQMLNCGADLSGEYSGQAIKDYTEQKVQNPSDTKRRILESMSQVKEFYWEKNCKCLSQEIKPCVVLDPFAGSGTTLGVAEALGRDSIGIELNPEYVPLIPKRIEDIKNKMFTKKKKWPKISNKQLTMKGLFSDE